MSDKVNTVTVIAMLKKDVTINVRVPKQLKRQLEAEAKSSGVDFSKYVLQVLLDRGKP